MFATKTTAMTRRGEARGTQIAALGYALAAAAAIALTPFAANAGGNHDDGAKSGASSDSGAEMSDMEGKSNSEAGNDTIPGDNLKDEMGGGNVVDDDYSPSGSMSGEDMKAGTE